MVNFKKAFLIAFASLITLSSIAQGANEESGFMRSEGKIYVVMAVVITILAGLILYMVRLDKKLSKFEKGENL